MDVDAFLSSAKQYGALIERRDACDAAELLAELRVVLPRLYREAALLEDVDPPEGEADLPRIPGEVWERVRSELQSTLGPHDVYWSVFDPVAPDPEVVAGSLADDLADIWRDLEAGLRAWPDAPPPRRRLIVWEWRFSFHSHWSNHAVEALKAIDTLVERYLD